MHVTVTLDLDVDPDAWTATDQPDPTAAVRAFVRDTIAEHADTVAEHAIRSTRLRAPRPSRRAQPAPAVPDLPPSRTERATTPAGTGRTDAIHAAAARIRTHVLPTWGRDELAAHWSTILPRYGITVDGADSLTAAAVDEIINPPTPRARQRFIHTRYRLPQPGVPVTAQPYRHCEITRVTATSVYYRFTDLGPGEAPSRKAAVVTDRRTFPTVVRQYLTI